MSYEATNPVQAVETAFRIVETIVDLDSPTVTSLADQLEMPVSTVHNHLSTLEQHGYLVKSEGSYDIGFRFLELGGYRRSQNTLFTHATQAVNDLAAETGDLANLWVEECGRISLLYLSEGEKAVQLDTYTGVRNYLHSSASGKAILANLPDERIAEIIDVHGLPPETEQTITDRERLFDELAEVQDRGYALDEEERLAGLRCVGAPITTQGGRLLGSLSVSGPVSRFNGDRFREELPELVVGTADMIGINITYS